MKIRVKNRRSHDDTFKIYNHMNKQITSFDVKPGYEYAYNNPALNFDDLGWIDGGGDWYYVKFIYKKDSGDFALAQNNAKSFITINGKRLEKVDDSVNLKGAEELLIEIEERTNSNLIIKNASGVDIAISATTVGGAETKLVV